MVRITIDDEVYEVEEGRTILEAMDDAGLLMRGVDIPHFCWHPKLSIDGSCRMCQVQVDEIPKLQIACKTPVKEGMVVKTGTPDVKKAREGVLELLLLNHPLDCPICDQAGECTLQDYSYDFGSQHSRTTEPRRPAKKAQSLGPHVVLDQERCILCRRCVRFCREIPGTGELGVFDRGDRSVLEVFPGTELDNDYSMNVVDICPVGALTARDFRFKIRVWFLEDVASVCNQCSNGCNIWASRANGKVYRYQPRRNDHVNDTWMCDHGRLSYSLHSRGRMESPRIKGRDCGYDEAIAEAAAVISKAREQGLPIVGVASPFTPNEDLFVLKRLLEALGAEVPSFHVPLGSRDEILIKTEKAPNAAGARALGFSESGVSPRGARTGIVLGHDVPEAELEGLDEIILIDTHESGLASRARVQLPARTFGEREGSFTNHAGRVQHFVPFLEPAFEALAEGEILCRIASRVGLDGWEDGFDVRAVSRRLSAEIPSFAGIDLATLGDSGREIG